MDTPQRIAVINCQPIGDTIFSTPIPRLIKAVWPETRLDMVIDKRTSDIFRHNPCVDRVVAVDTRGGHRVREWFRALRALRAARYDMALNVTTNEGYSALAALCGARNIRGFCPGPMGWLFRPHVRDFDPHGHLVDANATFLESAGIPVTGRYSTELWIDDDAKARAAELWSELALPSDAPVVGVIVSAGKPNNRWPIERFAELTSEMASRGMAPVLLGGPADVPRAEAIQSSAATPVRSLAGQTTLLQLAAVFQRMSVVVTGDTGPMHVAATMKAPIVAMFGPADPSRSGPYGTVQRIVRPVSGTAMDGITPSAVIAAVKELLADQQTANRPHLA